MNRPKQQKLLAQAQPELLGVRAEDVLPEHMLLRFLSNCGIVDNDKPVDTKFAMRVAAMIAASEAFEEQTGHATNAAVSDDDTTNDGDAEAGHHEDEAMTSELDPSNDQQEPLDETQLEEAAAIAAEAAEELAAVDEPTPEPADADDDGLAIDVGELLGDTAIESDDDAVESASEQRATITHDEEEIGALMADMAQTTDANEQQRLEEAFAEEPTPEDPASAEAMPEHAAVAEPVAQEPTVEAAAATTADDPTEQPEELAAVVDEAPPEPTLQLPTEEATVAAEAADQPTEAADQDSVEAAQQADVAEEEAAEATANSEAATSAVIDTPALDEPVAAQEPIVTAEPQPTEAGAPAEVAEEEAKAGDATTEEFALTNGTMDKVQDFLSELKGALVTMAQRAPEPAPEPPPAPVPAAIDVEPLMQAVQAGFEKSAHQAEQANTAVASLGEHMAQLGSQIEGGMSKVVGSMGAQPMATPATAGADAPDFVEENATSQAVVLGAVSLIVLGWSIVFWIKTGSPKLALGTLVGANVIACCLLLSRGTRK